MAEKTEKPEAVEATEPKADETPKAEKPVETPSRSAPPLPAGTHFIWGTGRRKAAIARVRIRPGAGEFKVNKRDKDEYFVQEKDRDTITAPLATLGMLKSFDVFVNVNGGGFTGQAGAVCLGLARALARHMPESEHDLRDKGLLTRDARAKERKKPGQPGARKRFQFSKR